MKNLVAGIGYKDNGKWAVKILGKFTTKAEVVGNLQGKWLNRDVYTTKTRVYAFGKTPELVRERVNRVFKNFL